MSLPSTYYLCNNQLNKMTVIFTIPKEASFLKEGIIFFKRLMMMNWQQIFAQGGVDLAAMTVTCDTDC